MTMPINPAASGFAPSIDHLFDAMLVLCGAVALGVFIVMFWMCVKFRRGSQASREPSQQREFGIEMAWTLIPFLLFVAIFGWSIGLWKRMQSPPADSTPIYVIGKQWMWKIEHSNGRREINTLHVPLGEPVRLVMTSQDVIHSFYIPAFRIKQDVVPGRYTQLWFEATRLGTYNLFCSEFCGTNHAAMVGTIVVVTPQDYRHWLSESTALKPADRGRQLFVQFGCSGCHDPGSGIHAPSLHGLYGTNVQASDGSWNIADDHYLHEAIVHPGAHPASGYAPIMPVYQNRIDEEDILSLIAYIKSMGPEPTGQTRGQSP